MAEPIDQLYLFDMRSPVETQWRHVTHCYPRMALGPTLRNAHRRIDVRLERLDFYVGEFRGGDRFRLVISRWNYRFKTSLGPYSFRRREFPAGDDPAAAMRLAERWHALFISKGGGFTGA